MPQETGYTQRVTPQAGAPAPLTSPADFGSDVGGAVEQAGNVGNEAALKAYQINRSLAADSQSTDFAAKFAALRPAIDANIQRLRTTDFNADSHVDDVQKYYQDATAPLTDGITDQRVLQNTQRQIAAYGGELGANEATYAAGQRAAKTVFDYDNSVSASNMRRATAPSVAAAIQTDNQETVLQASARAGLQNVTPDALDKMALHESQSGALAMFMRVNQLDPQRSLEMLDGGQYNGRGLTVEQVDAIRNNAQVEIRQRDHEAKANAAAARAQVDANADVAIKMANSGMPNIPDAYFATLTDQANAANLPPARLFEIDQARVRAQVNHEFNVATLDTVNAERLRLLEIQNRSPQDQMRLNAVTDKYTQMREENATNPYAPAARAGMPVAPIDWSNPDPAAIANRSGQAYSLAQANHTTALQPLFPDEVKKMQGELATGPGARQDIMAQLDAWRDPALKAAALRQVAPNDKAFQHQGQLNPEDRAAVMGGAEVLKANPTYFKPSTNNDTNSIKTTIAGVDRDFDVAMKKMNPGDAAATRLIAQQYLAAQLAGGGHTAQDMTEDGYRAAYRVAMGGGAAKPAANRVGVADVGGLATWRSPDQPYVLPENLAPNEFEQAVMIDRAHQDTAGTGPVDRDGKTPFDLNNAKPVIVAKNQYIWETRAGTVLNRKGQPYITSVPTNIHIRPNPNAPKPKPAMSSTIPMGAGEPVPFQ